MNSMNKNLRNNQHGIVSLMVTMIMMLVISLIVLGFSQVARRNQREALDRQLSTQAYYAAESGVNVAAAYFAQNPTAQTDTLTGGDCKAFITDSPSDSTNPGLGLTYGTDNLLNSGGGVSYSCLMVNSTPASLLVQPLTEDSNTVWHLQTSDGSDFTRLKFTWAAQQDSQYAGGACAQAPPTAFPQYGSDWDCPYGILRVDLVDVAGGVTPATVATPNQTFTLYLVPTKTDAGLAQKTVLGTNYQSEVIPVQCDDSQCSIILNLPGGTYSRQASEFFARLTMLYQGSASATLSAAEGSTSSPVGGVKFKQGQAIIDATGKSQDELRRVQVRVPLIRPDSTLPIFGVQATQDICKQLTVATDIYSNDCP